MNCTNSVRKKKPSRHVSNLSPMPPPRKLCLSLSDHHRYKGEEAVLWRKKKQAQDLSKNYTKALTEEMSGLIDSFRKTHPNWQPDEVKKVVKCL